MSKMNRNSGANVIAFASGSRDNYSRVSCHRSCRPRFQWLMPTRRHTTTDKGDMRGA